MIKYFCCMEVRNFKKEKAKQSMDESSLDDKNFTLIDNFKQANLKSFNNLSNASSSRELSIQYGMAVLVWRVSLKSQLVNKFRFYCLK